MTSALCSLLSGCAAKARMVHLILAAFNQNKPLLLKTARFRPVYCLQVVRGESLTQSLPTHL